ncbi:hypothetical protein [Chitinophaga sp.]|uniref:hypothetical protein n=1 Tax=Chitinophaga sp. TaxID=1869181 RepID=UPI0031D77071
MTLDDIIKKAIPIAKDECKIRKAMKENLRLEVKKDLIALITANFEPKKKAE